ncbi:hypothetical protein B0T19DRAFT_248165 [Cercophora scortea]|uniref:Uncharacterized protein n=1 Tax=Cercophora scortea TaxID=314031 RepID=A0AAE0I953_9PEZI|nr:hypothetical protein B0T19DRAFT_248165 [Cercophora scortea]
MMVEPAGCGKTGCGGCRWRCGRQGSGRTAGVVVNEAEGWVDAWWGGNVRDVFLLGLIFWIASFFSIKPRWGIGRGLVKVAPPARGLRLIRLRLDDGDGGVPWRGRSRDGSMETDQCVGRAACRGSSRMAGCRRPKPAPVACRITETKMQTDQSGYMRGVTADWRVKCQVSRGNTLIGVIQKRTIGSRRWRIC